MPKKKKQDTDHPGELFGKAKAVAEAGTSEEVRQLLAQLQEVIESWSEEADRIRPPSSESFYDSGIGRARTASTPAGADYREAAQAGDVAELQRLRARGDVLSEWLSTATSLERKLEARLEEAAREEELAAAPTEIERLAGELPDLLDFATAALQELQERREALQSSLEELNRLRRLTDDRSAVVTPQLLLELGQHFNWILVEREEEELVRWTKTGEEYRDRAPALFAGWGSAETMSHLLGDLSPSWSARLAQVFGLRGAQTDEDGARRAVAAVRVRLLREGHLKALADHKRVAELAASQAGDRVRADRVLSS